MKTLEELQDDFNAGRITQAEFDAGVAALYRASNPGMAGVINNLKPLVSALGGAALGDAAGLAAVAHSQLVSHWDRLRDGFNGGPPPAAPAV